MESPRISVVIPCFNLGQYLDEAVDSILAQTYQDFEILIVDDGSTDPATQSLLAEYRRPRTRVVRSHNRGLSGARNLGLRLTTGPYVCMVDPDDRLAPELFEKSVAVLDADPDVAFVSHWLQAFGDEGWEWTPTACDLAMLLDTNTVNGAALVRRRVLIEVGGFDETMREGCEDWDLWISVVEAGFRGVILPEFLFEYRRRPGSMSRAMHEGDTHARLYAHLAEKHRQSYEQHLVQLVVRREETIRQLTTCTVDGRLELRESLTPRLEQMRDDVAMLEAKAERVRMEGLHREAERQLVAERDRLQGALAIAVERAHELDAKANAVSAEAARLRRSMSWRMTEPLRAIYRVGRLLMGRDA